MSTAWCGGPGSWSVTTTIETASVDDLGMLVHADDATAQVCLAFVRLEAALSARGLSTLAVERLVVRSAGAGRATDLVDVVVERLTASGSSAPVGVEPVACLAQPGMLVSLRAEVAVTEPLSEPRTPRLPSEGTTVSPVLVDVSTLKHLSCVLLPGDPGFDAAVAPWNRVVRQEPAAVAVPRTVEEVVAVVRAATAIGLRIAPQSTGHAATALADVPFADVLLLRLHELTGVTVDVAARTAHVIGGTVWREVVEAAAPYGLTALHGSAADVAVAGYVLGGGLSFYARQHGLAVGSVRGFDVVTATGELVRATADEHAALFWALRGGGGNFGVVVGIDLDLLPIPDVVAGMLMWDLSRGAEVLHAWVAWTATVPESVTTNLRFMRFPPLPELPPFLSGRSLVVIDGAILEDDEQAAQLLAPLRALGPETDLFGRMPAAGVLGIHLDPPEPTPGVSDHSMLTALPEEAVDALLAVAGPGVDTPLTVAELRHLGGALDRATDTALGRLHGAYALFALCAAPTPELAAVGEQVTADVVSALSPWANGTVYPNFAEREVNPSAVFGTAHERLCHVRELYDPQHVWVAAHAVGSR